MAAAGRSGRAVLSGTTSDIGWGGYSFTNTTKTKDEIFVGETGVVKNS